MADDELPLLTQCDSDSEADDDDFLQCVRQTVVQHVSAGHSLDLLPAVLRENARQAGRRSYPIFRRRRRTERASDNQDDTQTHRPDGTDVLWYRRWLSHDLRRSCDMACQTWNTTNSVAFSECQSPSLMAWCNARVKWSHSRQVPHSR